MSSIAIILVLISALCHSVKSLHIKKSLDKEIFLWCYESLSLIIYLPLFFFFVIHEEFCLTEILAYGILTGIIHFLYQIFFTKSYAEGDLSLVYPIMRSSPALVLLCAVFFLGEEVELRGVLGIILIAVGIYIINIKSMNGKDLLLPIRSLFSDSSTRFAFLTMLAVTAYSIIDKVAAQQIHPVIFSWALGFFTSMFFTPYVFTRKSFELVKTEWAANKKLIVINAFISRGGYLLILIAFTFEKVSYVAGFRQLSIVFAVIMGSHLLKEENPRIRITAAIIIFSGAFLIATAS